jgi:hypothetical protein
MRACGSSTSRASQPRGWLARRLGADAAATTPAGVALSQALAEALARIEERLYYARYGL